ncbi:MAG: hypothetical protein AAFQ47_11475 [Pseudomonadota bacterium]
MTKNLPRDFLFFITHVLFWPLVCITMVEETRYEWTGLGQGPMIDLALWFSLSGCAFIVISARTLDKQGPLVTCGVMIFMSLLIVALPILIGLTLFVGLTFVGGGPWALIDLWKILLLLAFIWMLFRQD